MLPNNLEDAHRCLRALPCVYTVYSELIYVGALMSAPKTRHGIYHNGEGPNFHRGDRQA